MPKPTTEKTTTGTGGIDANIERFIEFPNFYYQEAMDSYLQAVKEFKRIAPEDPREFVRDALARDLRIKTESIDIPIEIMDLAKRFLCHRRISGLSLEIFLYVHSIDTAPATEEGFCRFLEDAGLGEAVVRSLPTEYRVNDMFGERVLCCPTERYRAIIFRKKFSRSERVEMDLSQFNPIPELLEIERTYSVRLRDGEDPYWLLLQYGIYNNQTQNVVDRTSFATWCKSQWQDKVDFFNDLQQRPAGARGTEAPTGGVRATDSGVSSSSLTSTEAAKRYRKTFGISVVTLRQARRIISDACAKESLPSTGFGRDRRIYAGDLDTFIVDKQNRLAALDRAKQRKNKGR